MFSKLFLSFALVVLTFLSSNAQLKDGDHLLGFTVGLGLYPDGRGPTFGANFESQLTQAGIGTLSLGGVFRYYSFSVLYGNGDSRRVTYTTFGVQSNYNFNEIGNGKFVPFVGLVVGYNNVSQTYTDVRRDGIVVYDFGYQSGAWLWGQAGFRYFFTPAVAGAVRLGFGNFQFNALELGIDFKL